MSSHSSGPHGKSLRPTTAQCGSPQLPRSRLCRNSNFTYPRSNVALNHADACWWLSRNQKKIRWVKPQWSHTPTSGDWPFFFICSLTWWTDQERHTNGPSKICHATVHNEDSRVGHAGDCGWFSSEQCQITASHLGNSSHVFSARWNGMQIARPPVGPIDSGWRLIATTGCFSRHKYVSFF